MRDGGITFPNTPDRQKVRMEDNFFNIMEDYMEYGKTKALFLDVDGTLLSFRTHKVPESAVKALEEVRRSGVKVIIATGRTYTDLNEISEVPYDAVVSLNGAECVLRDGTPVSQCRIPEEDFLKALELSGQYGFAMGLETTRGVLVNRLDETVTALAALVAHPLPEVVDLVEAFRSGPCCQLCFYCDTDTEKKVLDRIPGLASARWYPIYADINVKGVDKGKGIARFAEYYGFEIGDTMSFGDGGNDIPMLRAAGTGIAMGNASEEVRKAADYVTDTVDEDGVAKALRHFGLIS